MQTRHVPPAAAWAQFAVLISILTLLMLMIMLIFFYRPGTLGLPIAG